MNKPDKPLYLLIEIGPLGFTYPARTQWLDAPPADLSTVTRGEGQALLFKLERYDCSSNFDAALRSGELVRDFNDQELLLVRKG